MEASRPGGEQQLSVRAVTFDPAAKKPLLGSLEADFERWASSSSALGRSNQAAARAYAESQQTGRQAATDLLSSSSPGQEEQTETAVTAYVSSLLLSVNRPAEAAALPGLPEASQVVGDSPARSIAGYGWRDVLVTAEQSAQASDTVFELASLLIAWALYKMRAASATCAAVAGGAPSDSLFRVRLW